MTRRLLCAALLLCALVAAGCGSGRGDRQPGAGVDAGASVLRGELTSLLVAHAHLNGLALLQLWRTGPDDPSSVAAARALDGSATAFGDALTSVVGPRAGDAVTRELHRHDDALRADAQAAVAGGPRPTQRVVRTRDSLAAALHGVVPDLQTSSVTAGLAPAADVSSSLAADDGEVAKRIADAGSRMPRLAEHLAAALVAKAPRKFDGRPGAGAAELRANLTAVLEEDVHRLGVAAVLAIGGGPASAASRRARRVLDASAVALGDVLTAVYGQDAGAQARIAWRRLHAGQLGYLDAKAAQDAAATEVALGTLDRAAAAESDALAAAVPTLRRVDVAAQLDAHVAATTAMLRAAVSRSPKLPARVQEAAGQVLTPARTIAAAIQADRPSTFPAG